MPVSSSSRARTRGGAFSYPEIRELAATAWQLEHQRRATGRRAALKADAQALRSRCMELAGCIRLARDDGAIALADALRMLEALGRVVADCDFLERGWR